MQEKYKSKDIIKCSPLERPNGTFLMRSAIEATFLFLDWKVATARTNDIISLLLYFSCNHTRSWKSNVGHLTSKKAPTIFAYYKNDKCFFYLYFIKLYFTCVCITLPTVFSFHVFLLVFFFFYYIHCFFPCQVHILYFFNTLYNI